ncbi:MAG: hypothetical protein IT260_17090 [Saprospiraceae bacterium]|nr:hypothetical protein [Saprospiraceae bacterium]
MQPTPDFEAYARTLQRVMQAAVDEAESLRDQARAERDAAHADRMSAQDILHELDQAGRIAAQDYVQQHRRELNAQLRLELQALVATKLLNSGQTAAEIAETLQVPAAWVERVQKT